jgi:parvulin-like peptidyl-prolyl isomerase
MVKSFSDVAFAMTKPGEISQPIESDFGFHLIKLNKTIEPEKKPFEKVQHKIVKELRAGVLAKAREQLLLDVRSKDGLVINREAIDKLAQTKK